LRCDICR